MGVKVRFWKRAWWVFVNASGRRKAKRLGDRETALRVGQAIREKLARGDLNLAPASDGQTLRIYRHLVPGGNRAAVDRLDERNHPQPPRNRKRSPRRVVRL